MSSVLTLRPLIKPQNQPPLNLILRLSLGGLFGTNEAERSYGLGSLDV